jgi:hypothetical protein
LVFFKDIFSKIYIDPTGDSYYSFYSWNTFFRQCIERGIFPLWNPLVLCGHPFHLESVSNFSLANLLLVFFNVNVAWSIKLFLSAVLSGWLTFILLKKQFKISSIAAFIAGLTYMFLMPDLFDNPPFFLPLIFIVTTKYLEQRKFLWLFLLSITLSAYFFNANPQFVLYLYLFIYFYIVSTLSFSREIFSVRKLFYAASLGFLPFIAAIALSSLRIIPMFEILNLSHRSSMSTFSFMLLPSYLINIIYPKFYMASVNQYLNFFPDEVLNGIISVIFGAEKFKFINGPYIGIMPFIFALLIILKKNKTFLEKFFSYSAIGILSYVTLNAMFYPIIVHIPLLNKMPFIGRSYLIYNFSVAILAGFGVEALLKKEILNLRKILRFLSILVISVILLRAIIQIILVFFSQNILAFLSKNALPYITKQSFCKASSDFYCVRLQEFIVFCKSWADPANIYFLIPTLFLFVSLAILFFYLKNKVGKVFLMSICILVIFVDSYYNFHVPSYPKEEVIIPYGAADFIKKQQGIFRVMPLLRNYDEKNPLPMDIKTFLRPESNMAYGIMTPEGYRSLYLDRYADMISLLTGQPPESFKVRIGEFDSIDNKIASLMNVKYVITTKNKNLTPGYSLIYEDETHRAFLNENVLPRTFVAHNVAIVKQKQQVLNTLVSPLDLLRTVVLEEDVSDFIPSDAESTTLLEEAFIEKYGPNEVVILTGSPKDGFLVLLDCYYPGWEAYVDDKPAKIYAADYIFRAVRVPAGAHSVKFVYNPISLRVGFGISISILFCGIILCVVLRKR